MMNPLVPVFATIYWLIGDTAPDLQSFEDIPFLFVALFLMFWPLLLVLVFAGLIMTLLEVASPGVTKKIAGIFKL